ncbi:hypothetical protein COY16_00475 [Candidatus Roizmanbacteria bacterium CG_4_10_14_0_2_um_filter_39_13]|uniref:Glycosyltransferase 2-like domain-containing protein n=1 Tax=Candidatus Roizmanbacteria bacterium CG_4_10_14_0_2_um_filter_39_13 TaxID=1974825 RepID=A0A2M7U1N9_9BACT|nr:MAG: hypothetical protein COY16_00475 [Candidatus Roizmanbacteria bacterium CG_4_10_14_0_2_um_filter_39_13]
MISCIIPFHNEKDRIHRVLKVITQIVSLDEIICVDDGSTDGGRKIIQENFPKCICISSEGQCGKSHAVQLGLHTSHGDTLFLLDADLKNLKADELSHAIKYFENNPTLDMLLLPDLHPNIETRLSRHDIIFSGKRVLKRRDLLCIFSKYSPKRYQLEIAINQYMMDENKNVEYLRISSNDTVKSEKIGLIRGTFKNISMLSSIVLFRGFFGYISQVVMFGHDEVRLSS